MHYSLLIKTSGVTPVAPVVNTNDDGFSNLMSMLSELSSKMDAMTNVQASKNEGVNIKYNLTEEEVNNLLSHLIFYQEEVFTDIPLSKNIDPDFLFNVPKAIYNMSMKEWEQTQPVYIRDPMYWFYLFLMDTSNKDNPELMISRFVDVAISSASNDEQNTIVNESYEYTEKFSDDSLNEQE